MSITMLISVTLVYAGETAETVHAEETQTAEIAEAAEIGENDLAADAGEAGDEDNASEAEEIQNTSPGVLLGGWNIAEDTTVTENRKKYLKRQLKDLQAPPMILQPISVTRLFPEGIIASSAGQRPLSRNRFLITHWFTFMRTWGEIPRSQISPNWI